MFLLISCPRKKGLLTLNCFIRNIMCVLMKMKSNFASYTAYLYSFLLIILHYVQDIFSWKEPLIFDLTSIQWFNSLYFFSDFIWETEFNIHCILQQTMISKSVREILISFMFNSDFYSPDPSARIPITSNYQY